VDWQDDYSPTASAALRGCWTASPRKEKAGRKLPGPGSFQICTISSSRASWESVIIGVPVVNEIVN
jgi:hypothetical protein